MQCELDQEAIQLQSQVAMNQYLCYCICCSLHLRTKHNNNNRSTSDRKLLGDGFLLFLWQLFETDRKV